MVYDYYKNLSWYNYLPDTLCHLYNYKFEIMSYYDDFDEEQRMMFESDPYITGSGDDDGCMLPIVILILVITFAILIVNK